MSSPFAHLFVGYTLGHIAAARTGIPVRRLVPAAMFCALAADFDVIAMTFGVDHHSMWGHRGFLHSALASVAIAVLVSALSLRGLRISTTERRLAVLALAFAALSHGILDAFTACDYGVAFLAPFDDARYLSSWHPLPDSPDDPGWYVSALAFRILGSEITWIGLPCIIARYLLARSPRNKLTVRLPTRSRTLTHVAPRS